MFTSLICTGQTARYKTTCRNKRLVSSCLTYFVDQLTDFFLRNVRAVSTLALCWKTPRPLCLFCGEKKLFHCDLFYFISVSCYDVVVMMFFNPSGKCGITPNTVECRNLTIGWPLITSSRSSSCDPSLRSEKRSDTNEGGHLCKSAHIQTY